MIVQLRRQCRVLNRKHPNRKEGGVRGVSDGDGGDTVHTHVTMLNVGAKDFRHGARPINGIRCVVSCRRDVTDLSPCSGVLAVVV